MIYLDHAASTPVPREVADAMYEALMGNFCNPSSQYAAGSEPILVAEGNDRFQTCVAAPILAEGDLLGLVLFIGSEAAASAGEAEYKLAQTMAAFLGRHMEN